MGGISGGGKGEGEWFAKLEQKDLEDQRKERWGRINESRYIIGGNMLKRAGIPGYLKKG